MWLQVEKKFELDKGSWWGGYESFQSLFICIQICSSNGKIKGSIASHLLSGKTTSRMFSEMLQEPPKPPIQLCGRDYLTSWQRHICWVRGDCGSVAWKLAAAVPLRDPSGCSPKYPLWHLLGCIYTYCDTKRKEIVSIVSVYLLSPSCPAEPQLSVYMKQHMVPTLNSFFPIVSCFSQTWWASPMRTTSTCQIDKGVPTDAHGFSVKCFSSLFPVWVALNVPWWTPCVVGCWALVPIFQSILFIVALSLTLLVLSAWYFWSLAHSFSWVSNKWPFRLSLGFLCFFSLFEKLCNSSFTFFSN